MIADLKSLVAGIESNEPAPISPGKKQVLSVAQQKALDEQNQRKLIAECDVAARMTGRDDIEYDVDATPSRSVIVPPRPSAMSAAQSQVRRLKVDFKPLMRPSGNVMGKRRGEAR